MKAKTKTKTRKNNQASSAPSSIWTKSLLLTVGVMLVALLLGADISSSVRIGVGVGFLWIIITFISKRG